MSVLWKFCVRSLKENKRRTIVTILGTALATAMLTAVACALTSALHSGILFMKKSCDFHGRFYEVAQENLKYFQENRSFEEVWTAKFMGYSYVDGHDGVALRLIAPDAGFCEHGGMKLSEGRFPEKEGEIALSKVIRRSYKYRIGDEITLAIGEVLPNDEEHFEEWIQGNIRVTGEKTYQIVGFTQEEQAESYETIFQNGRSCNQFEAYVFDTAGESGAYDILVRYQRQALKNYVQVNAALLNISEDLYRLVYKSQRSFDIRRASDEQLEEAHRVAKNYKLNELLAVMEALPDRLIQDTDYVLIFMVICVVTAFVFLIIIMAGVFCIDNSFDVSFLERIRLYGILSSVGTTKKQKRQIVWIEAFLIGIAGIPLGILMGLLFTLGMVGIANAMIAEYLKKYDFTVVFSVAWWGIILAAVLAAFMICLSAMGSAVHASRIMPIEAIRMNEIVKSGKKKTFKTPRLIRKLFGIGGVIAWQNYKRSKVKYRATITSISVSVALLLSMTFIGPLFQIFEKEASEYSEWNLEILADDGFEEFIGYSDRADVSDAFCYVSAYFIQWDRETPREADQQYPEVKQHYYLVALDEKSFDAYCEKIGLNADAARDKGIAYAANRKRTRDANGVEVYVPERFEEVPPGTVFEGEASNYQNLQNAKNWVFGEMLKVETICQSDELPGSVSTVLTDDRNVLIFVSESFERAHASYFESGGVSAFYVCEDAYRLERELEEEPINIYYVLNMTEMIDIIRFVKMLVIALLISLIIILGLIGATNVINAVTAGIELRAPEFARLKAMGMTEKQLRDMLWTEGFFVEGKGLFWGILVGDFISYAIYRYFWEASDKTFAFAFPLPILQSVLAILAVSIVMALVLHSGQKRLAGKNLIETIREENN